jgi:hypothetical protein
MQALAIYDQPHAEWLGEVYMAITPENIKEMIVRTPEHELSDIDAQQLYDRPWLLFRWLDDGVVRFVKYEKCTVYVGSNIRSYDIDDICIDAPKIWVKDVAEGTECFVIRLTNWLTIESV